MKRIFLVVTLIFFCVPAHAIFLACFHGPKIYPTSPNPTQHVDGLNVDPFVNWFVMGGKYCAPACGNHTQPFADQRTGAPFLLPHTWSWGVNFFDNYYRTLPWNFDKYLVISGPVGGYAIYQGTDSCSTSSHKFVPALFPV